LTIQLLFCYLAEKQNNIMLKPSSAECPKRESMGEIMQEIITVDDFAYSSPINNSDYRLVPNDPIMLELYNWNNGIGGIYELNLRIQKYLQAVASWEFAIRYRSAWKQILDIQIPKGTNANESYAKTSRTGMSTTSAQTFGFEIGASVTGEVGDGLFTKISATISSSYNESYTFEKTVFEEKEETFKPLAFEAKEDCMLTMWQQQCRYHVVCRKIGSNESGWIKMHPTPYILNSNTIKWDIFPGTAH
jgi:hypothetical protein